MEHFDLTRAVLIGTSSNFGAGTIPSLISVPVVYWLSKSKHTDRKLSLPVLAGTILAAALATGLSYHALVYFVFSNAAGKASGLTFFPISFLIATLLLPMASKIANGTRDLVFLILVAALVTWLALGGGYMQWAMYHSWPIDIPFTIVATTPIFAAIIYVIVKLGRNAKRT